MNSVRKISLFICLLLSVTAVQAAYDSTPFDKSYIIPSSVDGVVSKPVLLNGTWDFRYSSGSKWDSITVPGEAAMQGYAIEHDKPFFYRKSFRVPADYKGKRIILRFDGVYSHAILMVNGKRVREHYGGFTRWETDVTEYVRPGRRNIIELEVEDRIDDISYASGYAHHPIGGILRDVVMFAVPSAGIHNLALETDLDSLYRDAVLRLAFEYTGQDGSARFTLTGKDGVPVDLTRKEYLLKEGLNRIDIPVDNPVKWDADHPVLYSLRIEIINGGKVTETLDRKFGFRKLEVVKSGMLVNGKPIKLRGACRHDVHPTLGRCTTSEIDSLDAVLFKKANMNYVRTSHYPPSERFLEYCDRYGIYVECETAVCFVDTYRQNNYAPGASEDDAAFREIYLGQFREMVRSFRCHPSIVIWSIGNESIYGDNFKACHDWLTGTDTTRGVMFSYPGTARDRGEKIYDILSMHYPDYRGNLNERGYSSRGFQNDELPVIFDEWAHPACYTFGTLREDPNIREFWGKSIDLMWSGLFASEGGLGGAIWGYVDDMFFLPKAKVGTQAGNCVGYGAWGIVDVWRREKPEFWATKKAFSPIRLPEGKTVRFLPGHDMVLTVENRFDHTLLSEISAEYEYDGVRKPLILPVIPPHERGRIVIPADDWEKGKPLTISFFCEDGIEIDRYLYYLGEQRIDYPSSGEGGSLSTREDETVVEVRGKDFRLVFDKASGLVSSISASGFPMISGGPFLQLHINYSHFTGPETRRVSDAYRTSEAAWKLLDFNYEASSDSFGANVSGMAGEASVEYHFTVSPKGVLSVSYTVDGVPDGIIREEGLWFVLSGPFDTLKWRRNGYWNCYPEGAFAGNEGETPLFESRQAAYGEYPVQPWQDDTRDYFYWADEGANNDRPLTLKAKGMKENVYFYTLSGAGHALTVISEDANLACRMDTSPHGGVMLFVENRWDYPEIAWGNWSKAERALPCQGQMTMMLK